MNNSPYKKRWSVVTLLIILTSIISIIGFIIMEYFPDKFTYFALNPSNIMSAKYLSVLLNTYMPKISSAVHITNEMPIRFQFIAVAPSSDALADCITPVIGLSASAQEYFPAIDAG